MKEGQQGGSRGERRDVKTAYHILEQEKAIVMNVCHRNFSLFEKVFDLVVVELLDGSIDINKFLSSKSFRLRIYGRKYVDVVRFEVRNVDTVSFENDTVPDGVLCDHYSDHELLHWTEELSAFLVRLKENSKDSHEITSNLNIVKLRMQGCTLKEIGNKIGLTESAVSLRFTQIAKIYPEYASLVSYMRMNRSMSLKDKNKELCSLFTERIQRAIDQIEIEDSHGLSKVGSAAIALGKWYLKKIGTEERDEIICRVGLQSNPRTLRMLRNVLRKKSGAQIDFNLVAKILDTG